MIIELYSWLSNRIVSKWVVLALDVFIVFFCYHVAVLLRLNFEIGTLLPRVIFLQSAFVTSFYLLSFLIARSYTGIVRHTGLYDALKVLQATMLSLFIGTIISFFSFDSTALWLDLSRSVLFIHFFLSLFFLLALRFAIKATFRYFGKGNKIEATNVVIYGAGTLGIITQNSLLKDDARKYVVVAYLDDNPAKWNKQVDGIPVYSVEAYLKNGKPKKQNVQELIIAIKDLRPQRRKEVAELALEAEVRIGVVPPVHSWIQGSLTGRQIKNVKIEDLLERESIKLDSFNIKRSVQNKIVLVTGAAGSIGSEIARQLLHYEPVEIILLDQAESPLFDLEMELRHQYPNQHSKIKWVVGDVTNQQRMTQVFKRYRPSMIYHAAAYKHVPMMEENPYEAIQTNVIGTKVIADLAVEFGVKKFVMVSTDKAVNPTNVMGASKRLAEVYVQSFASEPMVSTQFITTRFGNVLGSNGSVIPVFKKQIEKGGPVTITHPDITRYFMTIPEACNLVLEAGAMGNGGEIFVFDMGESVKILDLAKKMISLSGLRLNKDIEIQFSGLRPGEKLFEELLANEENTLPTHHPQILIAKTKIQNRHKVKMFMLEIERSIEGENEYMLIRRLKSFLPEFVSNNSRFSTLDSSIQE